MIKNLGRGDLPWSYLANPKSNFGRVPRVWLEPEEGLSVPKESSEKFFPGKICKMETLGDIEVEDKIPTAEFATNKIISVLHILLDFTKTDIFFTDAFEYEIFNIIA